MKLKVYDQEGQPTPEEVEMNPKIFALEKINPELIHFVATALLGNVRNTVASTKTRGEVRGGGRKPWKQKGTGRARHGSIRSPLWKGGGVTFGPRPQRNFVKKVNKKTRRLGLFTILSDRVKDNRVVILQDLQIPGAKTKEFVAKLEKFEAIIPGKKTLVLTPKKQDEISRSAKNLRNFRVATGNNLNLLDLLWADRIIILKESVPIIEKTYLRN